MNKLFAKSISFESFAINKVSLLFGKNPVCPSLANSANKEGALKFDKIMTYCTNFLNYRGLNPEVDVYLVTKQSLFHITLFLKMHFFLLCSDA